MFVLEPIFHKAIWGGNRLVSVYGDQSAGLAHLYSLRCRDGDSNVILNGAFAGKRLHDIIGAYPLSIALVDAALDLSIQVHPGGDSAKYESYYFIDAPKSGYIHCGIDNMPAEEIRAALRANEILPRIGRTPVRIGDYIHIKPRTIHALTSGSFVYEIEQGEDNTYRLFDYGRTDAMGKPRDLQIEQAMDSLDSSRRATSAPFEPNSVMVEGTYKTQLLTDIAAFKNNEAVCSCLTLLSGHAMIDGVSLKMGMSVVLEPGEALRRLEIEKCIVASPRG